MMVTLIAILPLLAVLVIALAPRGRQCPDCGARLPVLIAPERKTRRMWLAGGYLCDRCGCETDASGRKVTADTPAPTVPLVTWAVVGAVLVALGVGLAAAGLSGPRAAAPPVVAVPQPAQAAGGPG